MKMDVGKLYAIAKGVGNREKKAWKNKLLLSMGLELTEFLDVSFEILIVAAYSCFDKSYYVPDLTVVAYGAGKMADKYIPYMKKQIEICEIWDAYSDKHYIDDILVIRPEKQIRKLNTPMVIFIDDKVVRYEVTSFYRKKGYQNIFYFRDYLEFIDNFSVFRTLIKYVTNKTKDIVLKFYLQYEIIETPYSPVLFSVLKKDLKKDKVEFELRYLDEIMIKKRLSKIVTVDKISEDNWKEALRFLLRDKCKVKFYLAYNFEMMLERLLENNIKTLERPMRMLNDKPYDEFAITSIINEFLVAMIDDYKDILEMIYLFQSLAEDSVPLLASACHFLLKCKKYTEALEISRLAMRKEPNSLLANETFYQVAYLSKKVGIYVEEPIPEYDLSERFCWSGLNFAWCGGFDSQSNLAEFAPCFRPLQCAARPEGEFWSSNDWKEFRRSVTDGSFRYCQKNQCTNIVAGWLPKKEDCSEEWLRKLLDGDLTVIPPIEELHLSYDNHCNLMCPSCRLEIQTNTDILNKKLDIMYEKNLKQYIDKAKHLTLSGCGEAMISTHSKRILQSFSKKNNPDLVVELRTNATTVNPVSWNSLGAGKEVIRHITVSVDASTKEIFEKLRYPAKWKNVLQNLKFIQFLRNSEEIDMFEFHVVIQKENVHQLYDIAKMAIDYDADAITYSRLINWRNMTEKEYQDINPFWNDHPLHEDLMLEYEKLEKLRNDIEMGQCQLMQGKKKIYINIHFRPDPNLRYNKIRTGIFKIR